VALQPSRGDFSQLRTATYILTRVVPPAGPAWQFSYTQATFDGTVQMTLPLCLGVIRPRNDLKRRWADVARGTVGRGRDGLDI
jgi:hypothetical protein